ncbi:VOC family protein [Pseudonocardia broussonetiae]|uniref:Glyoxalase n=1 Tax=Pseudonocardia broussonetiae TaxID=2736640 RepID=A0A6M6JEB5_9PSEU|nr:glyoxalase [Pseudonocardia broussonetiae]
MTDPLDALRAAAVPVDPDPAFARALRARLERALLSPVEDTVTTVLSAPSGAARLRSLAPYLAVTDAAAALDFYVTAFGGVPRGEPVVMPDGRVGHAEVALGDSVLMLAEEFPELGLLAPVTRGGVSQSLRLEVADPDAVVARAVAAGGVLERAVADFPHGRGGVVLDPSGHRWMVSRDVAPARPGDVVYASLWTADVERAERFYAAVVGDLGRLRITAGDPSAGLFLCYAVTDVDAATDVVRAAGGTARPPEVREYGRVADCVDDQGLAFALHEGEAPAVALPEYAELRVPDSVRARAFYATVLGWGFAPGANGGDYWNGTVDGERTRPRTGLAGGAAVPSVVPTFRVPDTEAALAAVRAGGGTAQETVEARFGRMTACVDDQGTAFRLLQP